MNYYNLPKEFQSQHEICWLLISEIEQLVISKDFEGLRIQSFEGITLLENEHPFDALLRNGRIDEHNQLIRKHVINGLLMDMCYFLQEALSCSAKSRLSVTMALLRKPFIYGLLTLLRLTLDESFDQEFNESHSYDPTALTVDEKKLLIQYSMNFLVLSKSFSEQDIFDLIFNKEGDSLLNMSDKALHFSTTRNKSNLSGQQNLNYIFATQKDIYSIWNYLYSRLPALLLYLSEVIDGVVFAHLPLEDFLLVDRIKKRGEILQKAHTTGV